MTDIADLTPDERVERLRLLADDYLDLHDVTQPLVWGGFVAAARELVGDAVAAFMPGFAVLFEDLCDALRTCQRAANDPAAYAASLGWNPHSGWTENAEQYAQAQLDAALQALVRPRRVVAS